jgi:hypothetical protein
MKKARVRMLAILSSLTTLLLASGAGWGLR